jgi:hypothetical protein
MKKQSVLVALVCAMLVIASGKVTAQNRGTLDPDGWDIVQLDTARDVDYLSRIEKDVILELNKVRSNPQKYADLYIKPRLAYFDGNWYKEPGARATTITSEGRKAVEECYNVLINMKSVHLLFPQKGLCRAAAAHILDISLSGKDGHDGINGSSPWNRMNRYGKYNGSASENISYGPGTGRAIVIAFLIDDGVPSRGHRQNNMSTTVNCIGVSMGSWASSSTSICVLDFANNYEDMTEAELERNRQRDEQERQNKITALRNGGVTSISAGEFAHGQLTSVAISNSVISIGDYAFLNNKLTSIVIPDSVTSIGSGAFGNNQLTNVTISNSISVIKEKVFRDNKLTSVVIPDNVTSIGTWAFENNKLTSVVIPNSVTSIGMSAFENNQLTSIVIPNSVTKIETSAFENNPLTSITIGNNISLGLSGSVYMSSFTTAFDTAYNTNGKKGGTYTYNTNDRKWYFGGVAVESQNNSTPPPQTPKSPAPPTQTPKRPAKDREPLFAAPKFVAHLGFYLDVGYNTAFNDTFLDDTPLDGIINNGTFGANLQLGITFKTLFDIELLAEGGAGLQYPSLLDLYVGGIGKIYIFNAIGLGFGGGIRQAGIKDDSTGWYQYLRRALLIRGQMRQVSLYGDYLLGKGFGVGFMMNY